MRNRRLLLAVAAVILSRCAANPSKGALDAAEQRCQITAGEQAKVDRDHVIVDRPPFAGAPSYYLTRISDAQLRMPAADRVSRAEICSVLDDHLTFMDSNDRCATTFRDATLSLVTTPIMPDDPNSAQWRCVVAQQPDGQVALLVAGH